MTLVSILTGSFIGVAVGIVIGFIILIFKRASLVKNSIDKIMIQKMIDKDGKSHGMKYLLGGKQCDFVGNIDKQLKKKKAEKDKKKKVVGRLRRMINFISRR